MMPTYISAQDPGSVLPSSLYGPGRDNAHQRLPTTAMTSLKRPAEDDDDIQFISEKPVKRRRSGEKRPAISMPQQPTVSLTADAAPNIASNLSVLATQIPSSDPRDTERRLSTGMVGLPSDIQAMELTYALRGVSMPVLENFVLDQPFRKPRPPSPPELSPKQMPSTISPEIRDLQCGQHIPEVFGAAKPSSNPIGYQSSRLTGPCQLEKPAMISGLAKTTSDTNQIPMLMVHSSSNSHSVSISPDHGSRAGSKSTSMPPPPPPLTLPRPEAPLGSGPKLVENHHHHNSVHSQKQPCQICSRLRHQAQLSRAQGFPLLNTALPPHFMPQLQYHPSYGQQIHPQILTIPSDNAHQYGSNFAPVMIPVNGNPFVHLSSHPPSHLPSQQSTSSKQKEPDKEKQTTFDQYRKVESPQISQPKNIATDTGASSSPIKPPASLIQPTYRKPSPNLIVDVAETCQEKFPFEEVAKRHNVPVDKVFDVFAAIIQVPLLRCPTDRRRPGRLATARIKEYNKAKKDILDSRVDESEIEGPATAVDSANIAERLGPVEFPKGFKLGGK